MFTPLRRFEFGKMLLNVIPVLLGSAIVTKIFTEFPMGFRLLLLVALLAVGIVAFFVLPKSMPKEEIDREER